LYYFYIIMCSLWQFQICQTYGESPSYILLLRCKYVVPCEYLLKNVDFITWFEVKLMPFLFCYYSQLWVIIVAENFICQDYSSCHSPLLQFIKRKNAWGHAWLIFFFFLFFLFFFFFIKWITFISTYSCSFVGRW
jgi:hypothetical protein